VSLLSLVFRDERDEQQRLPYVTTDEMGVPQFLADILAAAGRPVNLKYYQKGILPMRVPQNKNKNERRPLCIGVDVSSWVYKACQGYSDMLGDERHLTNFGRATLAAEAAANAGGSADNHHEELVLKYTTTCAGFVLDRLVALRDSCDSQILVVFDGATPPIKLVTVRERSAKRKQAENERDEPVEVTADPQIERRVRAFRRAGAGQHYLTVLAHVRQGLRENKIAFLVAPYESDGQLAFLSQKGYVDLIVTEDSDLVAYGASPILYKLADSIKQSEPRGILLRFRDLAANEGRLNLMDFSPAMVAVMFVATGSDYCKKLKGIGIVLACNIVRQAFLSSKPTADPLEDVFLKLFERTWESELSGEYKENYRKAFLAALLCYRHPVVYDPTRACCITMGDGAEQGGDPELSVHKPYAELLSNVKERERIVGSVVASPLATYIAEGWISARTYQPLVGVDLPDYVRNDLRDINTAACEGQEMESHDEMEEEFIIDTQDDKVDALTI
jgi:5'-3' exonuclease